MTTTATPLARFPIGTTYQPGGKSYICTVVDVWTTYNAAKEVAQVRYVADHVFAGQTSREYDVVESTIARGLITRGKA